VAISARLTRSLRQSLGDEGADDLVNWMVQVESNRSELHGVMEAWKVTTDARFAEFGARMDQRFSEFDTRLDQRFTDNQRHTDAQFAEMRLEFANLETHFERRFGDLIKWSFVFWCGAIGAVAVLARALR
jgi:hypothetical protein